MHWSNPPIVGLTGASRVGKDTVATYFMDMGYRRIACADPLKVMALKVDPYLPGAGAYLGDIVDLMGWEEAKDRAVGVREFLIKLGMAGRETFAEGEDFWVNRALENHSQFSVISDIRFLNEAARCRATARTCIIRLTRPEYEPSEFEKEVPLIDADIEVENDGELEDLRFKVLEAWEDWKARQTGDTLFGGQVLTPRGKVE